MTDQRRPMHGLHAQTLRNRMHDYVDRLHVSEDKRERLLNLVKHLPVEQAFERIHSELAGCDALDPGPCPCNASVAARIQLKWSRGRMPGVTIAPPAIRTDGVHCKLISAPTLSRTSMSARPWATSGFGSLFRRFIGQSCARGSTDGQENVEDARCAMLARRWRWSAALRRSILLVFVLIQTWAATYMMAAVLPYHGNHVLELTQLAIFALLFSWISFGFWTAVLGFLVLLFKGDRHAISAAGHRRALIPGEARTALLFPICNEDVARVFAGIRATHRSLTRSGTRQHFDFFILSDSGEIDTCIAELDAWFELCREVDGFGHVHYRRRSLALRRKSGNIADWCRRWGNKYRYMVVFDADSVMSSDCLVELVRLMQSNPGAGIIQTAPRAAGMATLHARVQQMATRVYGPLFTAGLHFWQLGESNYWGHNAIIRVAPFMKHCALGKIRGSGPLTGEILSHDFVEAALMRRAGWGVWIAYDLVGSYEEMPPSLIEELKRDRRWCQGNLQHTRLLTARGLHPAHRAIFMTGIMSYLSAPLWFAFLCLSTTLLSIHVLQEPQYFKEPHQLFPLWPEWHPERAIWLFGATASLLILPKVLAAFLIIARRDDLRGFGGPTRLLTSVGLEILFSALYAPIRMLFHSKFVVGALIGWKPKWKSPPRGDNETSWLVAIRHHFSGTVLGVGWATYVYWLQPETLWWLLPMIASLVLSIPLSVWSSRISIGRAFRRMRLFLIPEESLPPPVLRDLSALHAKYRRRSSPGLKDAIVDPLLNAVCVSVSAPRHAVTRQGPAREPALPLLCRDGPDAIDPEVSRRIAGSPDLLGQLHRRVWTSDNAPASWFSGNNGPGAAS